MVCQPAQRKQISSGSSLNTALSPLFGSLASRLDSVSSLFTPVVAVAGRHHEALPWPQLSTCDLAQLTDLVPFCLFKSPQVPSPHHRSSANASAHPPTVIVLIYSHASSLAFSSFNLLYPLLRPSQQQRICYSSSSTGSLQLVPRHRQPLQLLATRQVDTAQYVCGLLTHNNCAFLDSTALCLQRLRCL